MAEAPERIWAKTHGASTDVISGKRGLIGGWNEHQRDGQVEYTRSDIAERQIAELRAERDEARSLYNHAITERDAAEADKARLSEALRELDKPLLSLGKWSGARAKIRTVLSGSGAGGWREDRLPTHEEFTTAMAVIFACNGFDLSQWTNDIWPDEGLETVAKYMRRPLPAAPTGEAK